MYYNLVSLLQPITKNLDSVSMEQIFVNNMTNV